ncbi:MAG: FAD:protein FMN transferase [Gilvibacter sp.]
MRGLLLILTLLVFSNVTLGQESTFKRVVKLMGSRFEITVNATDQQQANVYIDAAVAEIARIEKIISSWDPNSETSAINDNAGIKPVVVSQELYGLIERAIALAKLTDGAFDISYASMDRIWKFDGTMTTMPNAETIKASISKVGYDNIILNPSNHSVFLKTKGMKIGFGGIGKGYAADKAKELLISLKVSGGIINASGDMSVWGIQSNGTSWDVALTNPLNKNKVFALFPLDNSAVVTSGNYEKYVSFNNVRYSHIIDPRTGYPSKGIISATVFAPQAELADALATSVFVMGKDVGIDRIEQLPNIECILIDQDGNIITSSGITLNNKK